jgi:hypothetical protein
LLFFSLTCFPGVFRVRSIFLFLLQKFLWEFRVTTRLLYNQIPKINKP